MLAQIKKCFKVSVFNIDNCKEMFIEDF